ncbi:MAG: acyl-CoA dehydrogenase, partial [Alphaproteobacteria bacterium]|nr:acyl-CoA dehydrogenase [Alphaproteobacteria bacterium]
MDFELPEDIRLLRDTVRKFVDRELIPIEMHSMQGPDLKPEYKMSLEAKARELGLWKLDTP